MNTASPMQRPLPYNIEAEQAVIGSVMIDNSAVERIPYLQPSHFHREAHQWIYETILDLWKDGFPLDPITVGDALDLNGRLNQIGGPAAVTEFFLRVPTAIHVEHYAKLVYRDGELRKGIGASEKAVRKAYETGNVIEFQQYLKTAADSVRPIADRDALDNQELGRRILEQVRHTHATGEAPLLPMNLAPLADKMNGWERKKVTVLGSLSSVGKSSFAIDEAIFLAEQGYHVVDISIEIDAVARVSRYLSRIGAIDETQLIRGYLPHDTPHHLKANKYPHRRHNKEGVEAELEAAAAYFARLPISIVARDYDSEPRYEPDFTPDGILNHLRKIHATRPIDFFIVDHIHIIRYSKNRDGFQQNLEYGDMVFVLRELAESFNAHALLLHQLDEKARMLAVPDSSCFPGSQRIFHNVDNLIALYNPTTHDKSKETDKQQRAFNLIKVRRGQTDTVQGIRFDGAVSRFSVQSAEPPYQNGTSTLADRFGRSSKSAAVPDDLPGWD